MARLLFLEFNEVSFESLNFYCSKGLLPAFSELIERSGWSTTRSEQAYEHLEPWIQWVTAHTGLSFAQHGVFRLGDIVSRDLPQIWEQLEEQGLKVGAICPMNAKHRLRNPAFFVPDPWTPTDITAPPLLKRLAGAISQAVNDNATSRLTLSSAASLLTGIAAYARPQNYLRYLGLGVGALRQSWKRALFLDLLLADVFVREVRRTRPHFASVFLNAAAHIQHHYMFSSASYQGSLRNPSWYLPDGADPVLEVYRLYDRILRMVREAFPEMRIMIATGLHQVPYREVTYYWRLKDHQTFLRQIGVPFERAEPRMSRDFLLVCADEEQARAAAARLKQAVAHDGLPLFEVDNRGTDIFAMLTYPKEITSETRFRVGEQQFSHLHSHVAFVALKNGEHDGTGYFLDTGAVKGTLPEQILLAEIPQRIAQALNVGLRLPS
jgi:hypothetical protein